MSVILGINGAIGWNATIPIFSVHDSGATLFIDGVHVCSISEERLSRIKLDGNYPQRSIDYVLSQGNVTYKDVNHVVYTDNPTDLFYYVIVEDNWIERYLATIFPNAIITYCTHQVTHMYSSYLTSGFENCAVLSLDNTGSLVAHTESKKLMLCDCGSFTHAYGKGPLRNIIPLIKPNYTFGDVYTNISRYTYNLKTDKDLTATTLRLEEYPGKIMGLQGYGCKDNIKNPVPLFTVRNREHFLPVVTPTENLPHLVMNELMKNNNAADIAAYLQHEWETPLIEFLRLSSQNMTNLAFSGGCALNVLAVKKIKQLGIYENIHIFPAPTDAGQNFGAAIYKAQQVEKQIVLPEHVGYLGKEYNYDLYIDQYNEFEWVKETWDNVYNMIAQALYENKIIGWHQGRSEFGPRALGNRSILANPCIETNKQLLNDKVKFREYWRPYAPSVLQEHVSEWFNYSGSSLYMLDCADVRPEKKNKILGVVHVDNTARLQTVAKNHNPHFYNLINKFYEKSHVPMVLNTSFNVKGEPIVETPMDAINTFKRSGIDILVLGNYILRKKLS
jgi:carbamoyltransferase